MLLRLAYLGVTNAFALPRLLPTSDRDKDVEILTLRHTLTQDLTRYTIGLVMKPFLRRIFYGINFTPFIGEAERRARQAARR